MKKIKIPKFFHELFGKEQLLIEVILVVLFTIVSAVAVGYMTKGYWTTLKWYQMFVLWLLYQDIAGGVIANLSMGTDLHYSHLPKGRLVFISIHVQPLLLGWIVPGDFIISFGVWGFTICSALLVNSMLGKAYQRTVAGTLMTTGLIGLILLGNSLSNIIIIIYMMYMIKVIFSFAVFHRKEGLNE